MLAHPSPLLPRLVRSQDKEQGWMDGGREGVWGAGGNKNVEGLQL